MTQGRLLHKLVCVLQLAFTALRKLDRNAVIDRFNDAPAVFLDPGIEWLFPERFTLSERPGFVLLQSSTIAIRSISTRKSGFDNRVTPTIVDGAGMSGFPYFGKSGACVTLMYSSTSSTKIRL